MAFQNVSFNKRRDNETEDQLVSMFNLPPVLQEFETIRKQWPERPYLPNLSRPFGGPRENRFRQRSQQNLTPNQCQQRTASPQWDFRPDKSNSGRKKQRLSFSRWNMMISSRYKTELCRQFSEDGDCPFEEKCLFAHGREEMRPLLRHPKYKTELCRDFHQSGYCSFGARCNFIHSTTDVATLSARLLQERSSTPDSGNESCDDQSSSSQPITPTLICNETNDDEETSIFHFPESLYRELTGDTIDEMSETESSV